jgi:hypothetical protein
MARTPPGACTTNTLVQNGTISVPSPGVPAKLCGGVKISGTLTMNAGVYYVDGEFTVPAGGTLVATTGVTIAMDGNAKFTISGSGVASLYAPTSGPTSGIAVMSSSTADAFPGISQTVSGGGGFNLQGVLYFPKQSVTLSGGANLVSVNCTEVIANKITISGGANLHRGNCPAIGAKGIGPSSTMRLVQ